MTALATWVAAVLLVTACGPVAEADLTDAVVRLAGTACLKPIIATGVVVDDRLVLTVAHAIAGAEEDLRVVAPGGDEYQVTVVGFDRELDLALLDATELDRSAVRLGAAAAGDTGLITAVNSDAQIESIEYQILREVNVRSGDIYDEGHVERDALDIQAELHPGVSGAPLIDHEGAMVGMVFAISNDREKAGYAIATTEIASFIESADRGSEVDRGKCR